MAMYRMVPERDRPDGWKILDLFGVPVYVDGWFLLFMGIIFLMNQGGNTSIQQAGLICFVIAFSLLLHELGHAFTARFFGVRAIYVRLTFFQGFAAYNERLSRGQSLAVVAAGPAVTFLLLIISFLVLVFGTGEGNLISSPLSFVLTASLFINGFLFMFNILPIHPMDGGQMLYHILSFWKFSQSALLITAKVSIVCSVLVGLLGLQMNQFIIVIFCIQFFMHNLQIIQSYGSSRW